MIRKAIIAFSLLLVSQLGMAQQAKYQEGVHYFLLDQAPGQATSEKIEVTEIFSYACSHCNTFEPYMQSWNKSKPDNVTLTRIPVVFGNRSWELMARGYITAEMMGIAEESHVAMMDAIWKQRKQIFIQVLVSKKMPSKLTINLLQRIASCAGAKKIPSHSVSAAPPAWWLIENTA
jgi:thiol:disulfide interchange protein DsbA